MKRLQYITAAIVIIYLILLIPESASHNLQLPEKDQFIWNRDSLWHSLEARFDILRRTGCKDLKADINENLQQFSAKLAAIEKEDNADDRRYDSLINIMFRTAPLIGACTDYAGKYIDLVSRTRNLVKNKSFHWKQSESRERNLLYKLIYGGRAAVEEILLQSDKNKTPLLINGIDEPSSSPGTIFLGVNIHSGDILVSRGGAQASALISRGSDYPGNFSHIALVYVNSSTNIPSIIESHIEKGVTVSALDDYIRDKKLRIMVLRLRSSLPELLIDPMLPHKAALAILERARTEHIPYDFEMDCKDNQKMFCSEVASSAYSKFGIKLWQENSTISSMGTAKLLMGFGVRNFLTQEPSDLEYDPKVTVIAEWRNLETLFQDHIDNAVADAILEWTEQGKQISIDWYMLPVVRIAKFYSVLLNQFNSVGPVPEGMSASSALRHESFKKLHRNIKDYVLHKVKEFSMNRGYTPPYWRLLQFARDGVRLNTQ